VSLARPLFTTTAVEHLQFFIFRIGVFGLA